MQVAGVQTKPWPHTLQIPTRSQRSVSSAAWETITFSLRDFQPPLNQLDKSRRRRRRKKKKSSPLIRHNRLETSRGPLHLFSRLMEKYRTLAHYPPTRLYGSISSSWAAALCVELVQLNLWKQLAHDVPSDKSLFVQTFSRGTTSHHEWWHSRSKNKLGKEYPDSRHWNITAKGQSTQ